VFKEFILDLSSFEKFAPKYKPKSGSIPELSYLDVGDEYFFDIKLKHEGKNLLYQKIRHYLKRNPDVEFATKIIKNGTIVRRIN